MVKQDPRDLDASDLASGELISDAATLYPEFASSEVPITALVSMLPARVVPYHRLHAVARARWSPSLS
jgi:hypothetical protein